MWWSGEEGSRGNRVEASYRTFRTCSLHQLVLGFGVRGWGLRVEG